VRSAREKTYFDFQRARAAFWAAVERLDFDIEAVRARPPLLPILAAANWKGLRVSGVVQTSPTSPPPFFPFGALGMASPPAIRNAPQPRVLQSRRLPVVVAVRRCSCVYATTRNLEVTLAQLTGCNLLLMVFGRFATLRYVSVDAVRSSFKLAEIWFPSAKPQTAKSDSTTHTNF
jgi:hypothetical protein